MKIRLVGKELFHAYEWDRRTEGRTERRTDMTKLRVAIRNFAKATKNLVLLVVVGRSN